MSISSSNARMRPAPRYLRQNSSFLKRVKSPVGSILAACLLWLCSFPGTAADVVFNEIHYHPMQPPVGPEPVSEEFIELYNRGTNTVQLAGWRIAGGVDYTFPQVTIPAGGYLVVVASRTNFETNYVGAGPVVGDWTGKLGNNWQNLELIDSAGETVDQVAYATQGDWATRVRGPSLSGTRGWDWLISADGFGNTLELINPYLPNTHGQNWGPSLFPKGTPGTANSALNTNSAPMLLDVRHTPAIPKPEETVYVRARLLTAQAPGTQVILHYRNASSITAGDYQSTELRDNGSNLDGVANDGIYGGPIPGQTNGAIIEFYVAATNSAGLGRTWPPPAMEDGVPVQAANAQYQVDGTPVNSTQPIYRIIMTAAERQRLQTINRSSDAQMNATFISTDDTGTEIRYRCGVRIRGAGSRFRDPPNYRVDFPNDQRWKGMTEINLNTQYGYLQVAGNILAQKAGLIAADARAVQVRVNGLNLASTANTSPQMGSYAALETLDGEWAGRHLPLDANGNMYRASVGNHSATLNKLTSRELAIAIGYTKASNGSEDDWSDLIALTTVLADTPTDLYTTEVRKVINVEQWMRYFAFMMLATSMETSYATGRGDDFSLYRGLTDPRFQILVHDLDTIFSLGDARSDAAVSIWRMVPTLNRNANTAPMDRFMLNNEFASLYFRTLMELINTAFSPQEFDPLIDQSLGSWVNPDYVSLIKSFQVQRNQGVLAQIPRQLLLSQAGFSSSNGLMVAESAITSLGGAASGADTHQVLVNGQPAQNWTAYTGLWQITNFALNPGVNQVLVQSIDAGGREIGRLTASIWLNSSLGQQFGGTLPGNTVWSAAEGPYLITNTLTVPVGRTLAIEGGASVFISPGASIAVNGSIQILGTAVSRIRLSPPPGVSSPWNGIQILNSAQSNRIAFADFIGSDGGANHVRVSNSRIHVEGCTWSSGGSRTLIELNNSSATITGCVFPDIIGAEHIHGGPVPSDGWVVIQNNTFGKTTLLNDIIDFTGARRPGPVLIVRGNIFTGASDDVLDLDGTDAWVEGNLFMHVHKDNPNVGDTASAINFGSDSGYAPHVVAVRNYFYEVDHVALCKEGGSIRL
ncbi:MAG: hypothetical protein FJ405_14695, partial [Verrucomicrobia bacterium]|nr:hypothetical protein [Verrucomicrobiota bacterium]